MHKFLILFACLAFSEICPAQTTRFYADELTIKSFSQGIPSIAGKTNAAGDSMRIQKKVYRRGIGVQSLSVLTFLVDQKATHCKTLNLNVVYTVMNIKRII
jgi:alpha-galactosidase